jgi:glycosyltransferase involved in cell wall biosynthesis
MNDHDYLTHLLKGIVLKPEQMRLARSVDARGILFRCRFPNAPFVSISDNQRAPLREANWIGTIYHGLPAELFSPSFEAGSYLAFLGRLTTEKGPDAAIRIARAAKMPLLIAAKVPREERKYFKEEIDPQIDGDQIQLIGEVNDQTKRQFLAGAAALLFPIDWPEQFGLVMIESLALRYAGHCLQLRLGAGGRRWRHHWLRRARGSRGYTCDCTAFRARPTSSAQTFRKKKDSPYAEWRRNISVITRR